MSDLGNGRPPVPGDQGGQRYGYNPYGTEDEWQAGTAVASTTQMQQAKKAATRKRGVRSLVIAAVGGVVGAGLLACALYAGGVFGTPAASGGTVATSSSGGTSSQSVTINTTGEDSTVSKAVAAKCLPSVVTITADSQQGEALGSGVILDTDGNIITNYHLFEYGSDKITVDIEGKTYSATMVGSDASSDIAVIKADLDGATVTPIERGDSDKLVVGDWVMTIGSPFGLEQSVSAGIVSALYRSTTMTVGSGTAIYANLIQVDASVNTGNSGGALVNDQGQLVGISTLITSNSGDFSGIAFAIPGNYALSLADKLIAGEKVTHAFIGVSMATVNAQNAQYNNLSADKGAYVADVTEGGPADEAGIKQGDIITSFDGEEIESADALLVAVRSHSEGDKVKVGINRDGKEMEVEVTLGNDEQLQAQQMLQSQQQSQQSQGDGEQYYNPFDPFGYGQ